MNVPDRDGKLEVTAPRNWKMVDDTTVQGSLIRWCGDDDVVLLQYNYVLYRVPRRRFSEADLAEVDKLLGKQRELIKHLWSLPVAPCPPQVKLVVKFKCLAILLRSTTVGSTG